MITIPLDGVCESCKKLTRIQYEEKNVITLKGCSNKLCKLFLKKPTISEIESVKPAPKQIEYDLLQSKLNDDTITFEELKKYLRLQNG